MAIPTIGLPAEAERIAEVIHDFDETLRLEWIEPKDRGGKLPPYRIVQDHPATGEYTVMFIENGQLDHRVIAALFKARNQTMDDIEAEENAKQALTMRERIDEQEEQAEFAKWAFRQTKTVQHNGVKYE